MTPVGWPADQVRRVRTLLHQARLRGVRISLTPSAILLLLLGCGASTSGNDAGVESKCGPSSGTVASVIDGDTITLTSGVKIRYLLVDAPEITAGKNDCYGAEARDFNKSIVEGKNVTLAYDEAACTDRFGRTLGYVTVDGTEVNKLLVERGFACVLNIPPAGSSRADEFFAAERVAKSANRGVWGACNPVTCD